MANDNMNQIIFFKTNFESDLSAFVGVAFINTKKAEKQPDVKIQNAVCSRLQEYRNKLQVANSIKVRDWNLGNLKVFFAGVKDSAKALRAQVVDDMGQNYLNNHRTYIFELVDLPFWLQDIEDKIDETLNNPDFKKKYGDGKTFKVLPHWDPKFVFA